MEPPDPDPNPIPHISLNAMEGTVMPGTFRLYGLLRHHRLAILVDGGSIDNFIQTCVAMFLHLPASLTNTLRVMVGDNNTLDCDTTSL